ncbi:MAG: diguanylate cyclase [Desulfamplus sp.]|nr:diguanylate cyclase [Desulfamplus sp.]
MADTIDKNSQERVDETPCNILLVDDNPQNLRLLIAILSMRGYKVRPAPSGAIALESALSTPPDIILLDIMMPEMDGYEVCQKLKENELTSSVPVIFISAMDAVADKVKAFEMGAVDYITKPFQAEEILARVNTHLSLRRTQRLLEEEIERRKASEEILKVISMKYQKMATQDYLTGVSNRRYFMERAEEELSRANRYTHPLTFMMMDIDHFKRINDTYGHQAGDQILKNVANICVDTLRVHDLFGRIGGEEFSAMLPETTLNEALIVAERIRKAIEDAEWEIDGKKVCCTLSIGMSQLNDNSETLDNLMKKADEALYLAKSSGRNCIK